MQSVTGKQVAQTNFYDDATRRLTRTVVDRSVSPLHLADVNYTYDAAGNVTKIADTPVGGTADTQCFGYDYLRRLTSAWTATDACATSPSAAILGGPAPYWQSWTYDKTGNRLSETNYNTTTGVGVTSTSTYPAAGAARPHALSTVATSGTTNSFTYDAEGNTIGRTIAGSTQALTWDAEGNLTKVVEGSKTTEFLYDADGNRIIRRDPDAVTLYLGGTEVKLTKSTGALSATRYYKIGSVTAVRTTAGGLTFEAADRLGTAQLSINAADLTVTQRRYLPFGELRGTAPTWPTGKGYVGGTVDSSTGLTQLGARDYDPDTGRFMSVDPIIDTSDPQQMNAYAYANNTPVTMSDPDGQWRILPGGHYCDGCPSAPSKPKKKKNPKPKSSPASHHYCDGCDYTTPLHPKKVYPGDLRKWDNAHEAEARRLAQEYAAKLRREAAARKAKLAALAAKQKKWDACAAKVGPNRTAMCGADPKDAGKPKSNPLTFAKAGVEHLWEHMYVSWSLCSKTINTCGKLKFQHGKVSISSSITTSPSEPSKYSFLPTIGYQHRVTGREPASVSGSLGRYGAGFGWNEHGVAWSDWDVSVGTNPKGGWIGTENNGIAMFGLSAGASTPFSWCLIGSCK
jgi:RHS repeat-associated protein